MVPSSLFPLTLRWVPPWVRTRDAEPSGAGDYANPTRQSGPGWDTIPPVTPKTHLKSEAVLVEAVEDARRAPYSEIHPDIGRASCREQVCQYEITPVVAGS